MKLKLIISRDYFRTKSHPINAKDSVICILECGHKVRFKGSKEPSAKAGCLRCHNSDTQSHEQ